MEQTGTYSDDRHLVKQVLQGDRHAFTTIIKNTENLVAQIIFRMIDDAEDRRDLAQEVYLKAYKSLPHFRFGSKLSTWIGQIAYKDCLDQLQKKKLVFPGDLQEEMSEDESLKQTGENIIAHKLAPDTTLFRKQLSQIIKKETDRLPPIYKTLITLFHQEEMSYEEITQITGLPAGTLKSYLFRARKALKENLLRHYKKEEL